MEKDLDKLRHSAAHVLAQAVLELYPDVKLAIGPPIENGFYYDFDKESGFTQEELEKLEKKSLEIIKRNLKIEQLFKTREEAKKLLKNQPYKLELLNEFPDAKLSFYKQGDFIDLCKGPHVSSTGEIKAFKILHTAGAYWRGDSKNKMLSRIYGTAFYDKKDLDSYLKLLEESKLRDHKKIGEELNLYMISEDIGKGLPIWLPKGEIIKREIENFAIETENKYGYSRVSTPHLSKEALFRKSGHIPHYQESMYPSMKMDDGVYYLKAMNCPMHHTIFNHGLKSYKDFPIRLAEYGTVYRNELSGTLSGLLRVRMLSMNDAHIYCLKEQIQKEVESVIEMIQEYYKVFGFKEYIFRLSLWDPKNKDKYIGKKEDWEYAQNELRKILRQLKVNFVEAEGEAAFYGPKIDVQFKTVLGREESLSTVQLDFAAKDKFKFKFFDKDGKASNEVFVIHRAPLSTSERLIAFLIEHYYGKFPLWMSPIQVKLLTVTERNNKFAEEVHKKLKENSIRVDLDTRSESIGKKVRDAISEKVNYTITIGDKETESKQLAIRSRDGKVRFNIPVDTFIKELLEEIKKKC